VHYKDISIYVKRPTNGRTEKYVHRILFITNTFQWT